jgi:long-chain acyl-CoA synthetase
VPSNLAEILTAPADQDPERVALVLDSGESWSYGRLRDETAAWATTLADSGVQTGDRLALVDWGGVRSTAATLAAAHIGATTAHMNPLLTTNELAALVDVSYCISIGVANPETMWRLHEALGSDATVLTDARAGTSTPRRCDGGDDEAMVLFTSGTTGLPKPVPISHRSLLERVQSYRPGFAPDREPAVSLMCVPSFHVGGIVGLLLNLHAGDTTVMQARFDAGAWLALVERHRVQSGFLVPTMLARILDHPNFASTDLSSLRRVAYGAAAASPNLVRRAIAALPQVEFSNVFGQTETLGAYTALSAQDHHDPRRAGSVGRPLPGVEIRIVDPSTDLEVSVGEVGELWVHAPQNMVDDWLQTGDLVLQDAEGFLYPQGRRGDLINRGGEKFSPLEIVEVLRDHPAVEEAAVVGVPDDEMGNRVGVAIVLVDGAAPPTLDELRSWSRQRLAPFKQPEVLVLVDELPVNELGKLPRNKLVDLIASVGERER